MKCARSSDGIGTSLASATLAIVDLMNFPINLATGSVGSLFELWGLGIAL